MEKRQEPLIWTNQRSGVDLLDHSVEDEEEDLIGIVLRVACKNTSRVPFCSCEINARSFVNFTSNSVPLQAEEEVFVGGQQRTSALHGNKDPPQVQGDVLVLLSHSGCFPPLTIRKSPQLARLASY